MWRYALYWVPILVYICFCVLLLWHGGLINWNMRPQSNLFDVPPNISFTSTECKRYFHLYEEKSLQVKLNYSSKLMETRCWQSGNKLNICSMRISSILLQRWNKLELENCNLTEMNEWHDVHKLLHLCTHNCLFPASPQGAKGVNIYHCLWLINRDHCCYVLIFLKYPLHL